MTNTPTSSNQDIRIALLLGVTASGKSSCAVDVAAALDAEIVSVDSMQVYRGMDIGTAKSTVAEREAVPHHMIDIFEPWESCSAARYGALADEAIRDITGRGRLPLVVGGTPLYVMALMFGMFDGPSADEEFRAALRARAEKEGVAALHAELARSDPVGAERIHPNDYKRIERALEVGTLTGRPLSEQQVQWDAGRLRYDARVVGLRREKEDASRRINARAKQMIAEGLVEEVRRLWNDPRGMSAQARQALGYAQVIDHLEGRSSLDDAVEAIKIQTRQFAKHQRTWYRKFHFAEWIDVAVDESGESVAARVLAAISSD